jgi:hypothetical protein
MTHDLIEIAQLKSHSSINDFADAIIDSTLLYRASGLGAIGVNCIEELNPAIDKAMVVCATYGLPVTSHFKKIYISSDHGDAATEDWMLSKFAYMLVTLNCSPSNPNVGRFQIELIRSVLRT